MEDEEEKSKQIQYFNMALRLCNIQSDERTSALIISIYERLKKLGGDFSVHDAVALTFQNELKYPPLPDKTPQNTGGNQGEGVGEQ